MATEVDFTEGTESFQLVRRKHRKNRQKYATKRPDKSSSEKENDSVDVDRQAMIKRIHQCRLELTESDFYTRLLETVERAVSSLHTSCRIEADTFLVKKRDSEAHTVMTDLTESNSEGRCRESSAAVDRCNSGEKKCQELEMLVYGLGNFVSCVIARYQLALLLALRDHWQIVGEQCFVYDPQFTEAEKHILQELGCTVLTKNEGGKRPCERATLALMPHCGKALFNNFLWANWTPRLLQHLVVVGNSFSSMLDSVPQRLWKNNMQYVASIHPFVTEEAVVNSFTYTDIFNDLSVHWFPRCKLQAALPELWARADDEPVYQADELEIILESF